MEKSSYQKLRKKLDRIDFLSKYWIKASEEELAKCPNNEWLKGHKEGFLYAMEKVQKWLNEDEKSND